MERLDPEFRELLLQFLSTLLPILLTFLGGLASLLMLEARRHLAERIGQARALMIEHYVRLGVYAAEQYLASSDGQSKKAWALSWIEYQLQLRGIRVDVPAIAELIEAVVGQEQLGLQVIGGHKRDKPAPTAGG